MIKIREWLIQLRKERNLTQQQVAKGAFIDRAYYAQIETSSRNPSIAVASQIANFLHVNPYLFFSEYLSEPFEIALLHSPIIVAHCDLELKYTWMFNPDPDFDTSTVIGRRDDHTNINDGITALMELKRKVIETRSPVHKRILFPLPSAHTEYYVFGQPLYNDDGKVVGASTTSTQLLP
ncbi:helix-turn-helix domain-containing protein [Halobacillus shinanisalinarum]|uniref:Helix-turn-helix domain-containing protein n=1 Tax=Halobacillus shinanisalinarum TaxID=2932258 RepID=A0ABY4H4J3_9BACI|nr:helix-turn-helix domain-containing protein [Halobacillus shinanisalinarum]UOQ95239.1 helix-turn-helix domain-containing protein [Halobacillus shinanisalinarum]